MTKNFVKVFTFEVALLLELVANVDPPCPACGLAAVNSADPKMDAHVAAAMEALSYVSFPTHKFDGRATENLLAASSLLMSEAS